MPRYRVSVDVITDGYLTTRQEMKLASSVGALANVAAIGEIDGISANLRIDPVIANTHNHNSTPDYQCDYCRAMARDEHNDESQ